VIEAEAQLGIYRLTFTLEWRPICTNFGHTKKSWDMHHEPILQMESDRMISRYAYHKPFTAKFPDNCEWQNGLNPDKGGLVWYIDKSRANKSTCAGVYGWESRKENSYSIGLHTTAFQAKIYAIKAA
jgi:hypothetical protein